MRLPVPFTKLPLRVDAEALAAEIAAVDPAEWRPHPQQMAGNDALPLIAAGGDPTDDAVLFPVHLLDLVELGLTQGQNFDLEDLAADCADDGAYTFLLEASPIPFTGGVGAPVNPVAIK